MAHEIDCSNGRANMAYTGEKPWHGLGQPMKPGQSIEEWTTAAGLDWHAIKVPMFARTENGREISLPEQALIRSDTYGPLGICTGRYKIHQPEEVLDWFRQYVGVDERFQLETAGSLKGGRIIWAMARFNPVSEVIGEAHVARLLMTTSFDTTKATINKATMTRVVCNNTLTAALADRGKGIVRTRHNTSFDAKRVGRELANIASGFDAYRQMAEAMYDTDMSKADIEDFFRDVLGIDRTAREKELTTQKVNQISDLQTCYAQTVKEGTRPNSAWAVLNAVTRYVDHGRTTRRTAGASPAESRVLSSEFGSGLAMKARAVELLYKPAPALDDVLDAALPLDAALAATQAPSLEDIL